MEYNKLIAEMSLSDEVEGFYVLKAAYPKTTATGKPFLSASLSDRSGSIEIKVWDYSGPISSADEGNVVKIRGTVSEFRGTPQITADLSQTDALPELAGTVLEHLGHVDVLVNNAACSYINLFQCLPPEQVRRLYAVNLTAPVELSRLLLPSMLSRHAGCIVNISSMWGETGASCEVDYSVISVWL